MYASKRYKQGYYTPKNPSKYIGDINKIRYMSSWELTTHRFFDNNQRVIRWGSEVIIIPYLKPTDNRIHRYIVDYYVEYINVHGEIVTELIEVKPLKDTRVSRSRNPSTRLYENLTTAVNYAKWQAATQFASQRGWKFRIVSENSIFR